MKLLILSVLFSITQTGTPVPRQTPDSSAHTSQKNSNQAGDKQEPTEISPEITSKEQPPTSNGNRNNQENKNTNNPIRIGELPPVTVLPAKRDWVDWGYWGFGGLLAVVGLLQIWLLCRTLKISVLQAKIAHSQEIQMARAGQQTERIIAQMEDTATRDIRAYVGVSKVRLDVSDLNLPTGAVEIENFGRSPAYKLRHWTGIGIQPYPRIAPLPPLPETSFSVAVLHPNVKNTSAVTLKKRLPDGIAIGTPQLTIYVYGEVIYRDAFGKERHTRFQFFYGGREPVYQFRDIDDGPLYGVMRPDTEGNDAD
jgi:hypothetical protein